MFGVRSVANLNPTFRSINSKSTFKRGRQDRADQRIRTARKRHHHAQRVAIFELGTPRGESRPDRFGAAQNGHGQIDQVNSSRRQGPDGCKTLTEPPVIGRQSKKLVLTEIRFNLENRSKSPFGDFAAQSDQRRLEASFVSDAQHQVALLTFSDRVLRIRER